MQDIMNKQKIRQTISLSNSQDKARPHFNIIICNGKLQAQSYFVRHGLKSQSNKQPTPLTS